MALWVAAALGFGARDTGFLFAFMGLVSAIVQGGLIHRLTHAVGVWRTVILGAWLLAAGLAATPFTHGVASLALPALAMAVGFGMMSPSLNTALSLASSAEAMGTAMGTGRSLSTAARALGPIAAGALYSSLGMDLPFYASAVVLAGLAIYLNRRGLR